MVAYATVRKIRCDACAVFMCGSRYEHAERSVTRSTHARARMITSPQLTDRGIRRVVHRVGRGRRVVGSGGGGRGEGGG